MKESVRRFHEKAKQSDAKLNIVCMCSLVLYVNTIYIFTIKRNTTQIIPLEKWNVWNIMATSCQLMIPQNACQLLFSVLFIFNLIYFGLPAFYSKMKNAQMSLSLPFLLAYLFFIYFVYYSLSKSTLLILHDASKPQIFTLNPKLYRFMHKI